MAAYDLGDVVTLTATIRDDDGQPVDATAVVCTVTAPDATTSTPAVSHPAVGVYTATIEPATAGRYLARWVATGTNAAAFVDSFTVYAAVDAALRAEMAARVAAKSRVSLPAENSTDRGSLDAAVEDATALVMAHLRRDTIDTLTSHARDAIRAVIVRVAARFWRNPQDLASQSYNGMSISVAEPRVLTGDEQSALAPYVPRKRGTIFLSLIPQEELA